MNDSMAWLPTDATPLLEASLAYAEHGFRVLPVWWVRADGSCACKRPDCENEGKHPIPKAWQRAASSDESAVRDARRSRGDANIGLAMGGATRIIAVDVDGELGRTSWALLEQESGESAPETLTSRSGRADGGEHRLFLVPETFDWRKIKNRVAMRPGIDVRADAGQIVVAPSKHKSGARYTWSKRVPIAVAPTWLLEAIAASPVDRPQASNDVAKGEAATPGTSNGSTSSAGAHANYLHAVVQNACRDVAAAGEGTRNVILFAKACTVFDYHVGLRLDRSEAAHALEQAAKTCGLSSGEIRKALDSAWEKVKGGTGKAPPDRGTRSSAEIPVAAPSSARPTDDVAGAAAPPPAGGSERSTTRLELDVDGEGRPRKNLANVAKVLSADSRWMGVLAYNLFSEAVVKTRPAPVRLSEDSREAQSAGEWSESDTTRTSIWLSDAYGIEVQPSVIDQAVLVVARRNEVHPVRDYLNAVVWDGVARVDSWLVSYYGADDTEYVRGIGARWMISAIARIMDPGCQADCALILESPRRQGVGKSTGIEALVGQGWFSDTLPPVGDKDAYQTLRNKWIIEIGELASLKGRDRERVKNFISARVDAYRPSYGRRVRDFPRQCVFAGTTNEDEYLDDPTGNRRFWPVMVKDADRDGIKRDRDQLWAEAVHRYRMGEKWYVDTPAFRKLCELEQAERVPEDPWLSVVVQWLERPTIEEWDSTIGANRSRSVDLRQGVLTSDVLRGAMGKTPGHITKADQMRISEVLRVCGYERGPMVRLASGRCRRFIKAAPPAGGDTPGGGDGPLLSKVNGLTPVSPPSPPPNTAARTELQAPAVTAYTTSKHPSLEAYTGTGVSGAGTGSSSLKDNKGSDGGDTVDKSSNSKGDSVTTWASPPQSSSEGGDARPTLDLPDDFFGAALEPDATDPPEPDVGSGQTIAPKDACTCMAGPGEAHASWCAE